ncbi:AidA/PixA family protein [Photorhabdus stackebrandtii]|uniref:Inclusion body protein n=1 Tax=Photorhabdus stackebrandtii TaxID=1123042 RepID=A0A7X5TMS0_9GAMM|nr:AidA/PixA family protein [Photorhabdus stackebrandtii]NHB98540.1 hypothetical protein [Photorhabdus stackebrandtii]
MISILITLDLDCIVENVSYEDFNHIKQIDKKYINGVVLDNSKAMSFFKGVDILDIPNANKGNSIQWRVISLSDYKSNHSVILTKFKIINDNIKVIHSPIKQYLSEFNLPIIKNPTSTEPTLEPTLNYISMKENYWHTTIKNDNKQVQELVATFAVCKTEGTDNQILGYFDWSHKIKIGSK